MKFERPRKSRKELKSAFGIIVEASVMPMELGCADAEGSFVPHQIPCSSLISTSFLGARATPARV